MNKPILLIVVELIYFDVKNGTLTLLFAEKRETDIAHVHDVSLLSVTRTGSTKANLDLARRSGRSYQVSRHSCSFPGHLAGQDICH